MKIYVFTIILSTLISCSVFGTCSKEQIKNTVIEATKLLDKYKNLKISTEKKGLAGADSETFKTELLRLRVCDEDSIILMNMKGKIIFHQDNVYIGKNLIKAKVKVKGKNIFWIKNAIDASKKKGGSFFSYKYGKIGAKGLFNKCGFALKAKINNIDVAFMGTAYLKCKI